MATRVGRRPGFGAALAALGLGVGLSGCTTGALYTHVTTPLDTNLNRTPVFQREGDDSVKTFQYYVRVDWGNDAIGRIARDHGFTRVYYADLETITVLNVWRQQYVHVYGE